MAMMLSFAWSAQATNCNSTSKQISASCTIAAAGTWTVVADLNLTGSTSGISINSSLGAVIIKLNGFSIIGPGSGTGVGISGSSANSVTVENGRILSMGGNGITLGTSATVTDVGVDSNGGDGIAVGNDSTIEYSEAGSNGSTGIACGGDCTIDYDVVDNNATGISTSATGGILKGDEVASNTTATSLTTTTTLDQNVFDNNSSSCSSLGGGASDDNNVCDGVIH
jgi:hypothetical protein